MGDKKTKMGKGLGKRRENVSWEGKVTVVNSSSWLKIQLGLLSTHWNIITNTMIIVNMY